MHEETFKQLQIYWVTCLFLLAFIIGWDLLVLLLLGIMHGGSDSDSGRR